MEQFKSHPTLAGLYKLKNRVVRDAFFGLAAPIYMVLCIVVGVVFPTADAQLVCGIVGYILMACLAVGYVVIRVKEHRHKVAHAKFLEAQRPREAELRAWLERSELK